MTELKENMQQVWKSECVGTYHDQYGNRIIKRGKYFLYHKDRLLVDTYSLEAAKEISLVLINDRIING